MVAIMPAGRNKIGDIIPAKAIKSIWSYSTLPIPDNFTVKTPKGITITTAKTLTGEQTQVTETTRNEYNVSLPKNMPQEPFVIKLEVKDAQKRRISTGKRLHKCETNRIL